MFTSKAGYLNFKLSVRVQIGGTWSPFLSSFKVIFYRRNTLLDRVQMLELSLLFHGSNDK